MESSCPSERGGMRKRRVRFKPVPAWDDPVSVEDDEVSFLTYGIGRRRRVYGGGSSSSPVPVEKEKRPNRRANLDGSRGANAENWSKLRNLEMLFEEGFITGDEYRVRRKQLVDELTGTSCHSNGSGGTETTESSSFASVERDSVGRTLALGDRQRAHVLRERCSRRRSFSPVVIPRPPPDFEGVPPEIAIRHYFDLRSRTWTAQRVAVRLDDTPFARGGLRLVYHMQEESGPPMELVESSPARPSLRGSRIGACTFVAKMAIDPNEDPGTYFRDVEMQAHCAHYANAFNSYDPPSRVEFCKAWVLELLEREGRPLCAVERFIAGPYRKHNNNFGFVDETERNTPQAFSHFTYEASAHTMLVVDIQGVGDKYTDPQIHTLNGTDFGKGNLGQRGFNKFLATHRCNEICRYLKLPSVNPKFSGEEGTVPQHRPHIGDDKIRRMRFEEAHYYESAPELKKYLIAKKIAAAKARCIKCDSGDLEGNNNGDDDEQLTTWPADFGRGRGGSSGGEDYCFFPCTIL